jgi:hypothetical protein
MINSSKGRTKVEIQRKMPLQFIRPSQFAVDFGPIALLSDGKSLTVYDFERTAFYRRSYDGLPTTDDSKLTGAAKEKERHLLAYRKNFDKPDGLDQAAGAFGALADSFVLAMLLEENPIRVLAEGADRITVDANNARRLRIAYSQQVGVAVTVSESNLIERVEVEQGAIAGPVIEWRAGKITTEKDAVQISLTKQTKALENLAVKDNWGEIKPMAVAPGTQPPIPTPAGRNLLDWLLRLFR